MRCNDFSKSGFKSNIGINLPRGIIIPDNYHCFINIPGNFIFRYQEVAFMHLIEHGKGFLTLSQEASYNSSGTIATRGLPERSTITTSPS